MTDKLKQEAPDVDAAIAGVLSRGEILEADDVVYEYVPVPECGGRRVRVRSLSGNERDRFEASSLKMVGSKIKGLRFEDLRARLLVLSIVDNDGERIFEDKDIAALSRKNGAALSRIFEVAQRLSGISDSDIEELAEGLDDGRGDDSSSDARPA